MNQDSSFFHSDGSVTGLIRQLKNDDPEVAAEIWQRYFERLLPLARARLKSLPRRTADEEDVLVSVFDRFFRAANEGRFAQLEGRDDLWQILLMLTERRVADEYRKSLAKKRGQGGVVNENELSGMHLSQIHELADHDPSPEFIAAFNENLGRALERLGGDTNRDVALLRLEGYSNREIADRLQISLSSVERKIRLVKSVWEDEFQ